MKGCGPHGWPREGSVTREEDRLTLDAYGWTPALEARFAEHAAQGYVPGRVSLEHKHIYRVLTAAGEVLARLAGSVRFRAANPVAYPVVGDWVALDWSEGQRRAILRAILPRRTKFSRKAAGDVTEEQVVAANIDTVFLAQGLDSDFNLRRIERYLVVAWESGAQPVILLNKADLCEEVEARVADVQGVAPGVPVLALSAKAGRGLDELWPYLGPARTVAVLGSSGVGKSTLINRLLGEELLRTGELTADGARGRHTTTSRQLIVLPSGAMVIDTPGLRELQVWDASSLSSAFPEIDALAAGCRFRDCRHQQEPGCAVKRAVEEREIPPGRLDSYHRLRREAEFLARKQDEVAQADHKGKWKTLHKSLRHFSKG